MSANSQSLAILSPSAVHNASSSSRSNPQTTPKLPKRERLASFSRLLASESFFELMPEKVDHRTINRRRLKKLDHNSRTLPLIRVSTNSTQEQILESSESSKRTNADTGYSGLLPLPFSPNLNFQSPKYASPSYSQSSPMRSPLYLSDRKGAFLGRGSFGNVSLCTYRNRKFALKVIHDKASYIGERNFINIRHPHLVSILHIAPVLDKIFICMEFAGHCNLQQVLDTKSELDFRRRLSFTIQIALGLRHCHQRQIVHGDVKPANVIVSPYGVCKLGDFGHSISLNKIKNECFVPPENIVGTVAYAAPEVLRGTLPTLFSDIYSFSILLWQMQTREVPFAGEHPHVIIYKVAHYGFRPALDNSDAPFSDAYKKTIEYCWHDDPHQRLDISEALQKLKEIEKDVEKNISNSQ